MLSFLSNYPDIKSLTKKPLIVGLGKYLDWDLIVSFIGECNCKEGFLPWNNETADEVKKCYNQYSQGPCEPNCKFTWDYDTDSPKCLKTEVAKMKDLRGSCKDPEVLYPDQNGENHCYELDTQGRDHSRFFDQVWHKAIIVFFPCLYMYSI